MTTYKYDDDNGLWEEGEISQICVECIVVELDHDNIDISPIGFEDKEIAEKYINHSEKKCILVFCKQFGYDFNLDWTLN